ncbi:hypothetical protein JOS77_21240 [Chromobacterium haemolyticum]|nr:hypothetical protein JOS77_21240 [Chromobacterium haemolyticum]
MQQRVVALAQGGMQFLQKLLLHHLDNVAEPQQLQQRSIDVVHRQVPNLVLQD